MADNEIHSSGEHNLSWALCFEIGLGVVALVLGRLLGVWPAKLLHWPIPAADGLIGLLSAIPPLVLMLGMRRIPWSILQELKLLVDEQVVPLFRGVSLTDVALLSVAAGWGEELLFRGLVQAGLADWIGPWPAIVLASLLFGLVHFFSPAYFVMAAGISLYFGWLFWHFESLWIPVIAHALYDFLMLLVLQRKDRHRSR